ncbi:hypothetical protein PIB30_008743 [Stylosanthes scabra]|uniref:Uncharacterized protein n=1 Tax=Stylosanthes scabra TaxID=79078 RepID=A0ABU6V6R8_9FABA|nr:hypothetical protein [Stylosanthes scabra]
MKIVEYKPIRSNIHDLNEQRDSLLKQKEKSFGSLNGEEEVEMKINKACDLSSISVLPQHARIPNTVASGLQSSQPRSQPSQQSLCNGLSSQPAMFSQLSQNQSSLDEALINGQRGCSQEHRKSARRNSCFPGFTCSREESQQPNLRSSSSFRPKWNSADPKNQLSEGLEHRIGIMETSLSRFAMILDSVQSDVMQIKGQEEIKASIDGNLKLLSEQLCKFTSQEKLQEVSLVVSTLPQMIEASLKSLRQELHGKFTEEMQSISNQVTKREWSQPPNSKANNTLHGTVNPKEEKESWKIVKRARVTFSDKFSGEQNKKEPYTEKYIRGGKDSAIVIDSSDEETAGSCSFFEENTRVVSVNFHGEDLYGSFTKEEDEEAQRILQRARKRKRRP